MTAATDCLNVLNNETFAKNCDAISSGVVDHFLEACIRDHQRVGSKEATRIMHYSLIYYCVTVAGVDDCLYDGLFYFCDRKGTDDSEFPVWLIILIVVICVLIIAIVIVCCCFCICLKKNKRKHIDREPRLISNRKFKNELFMHHDNEGMHASLPHPEDIHETAFGWETSTGIGPHFAHDDRDLTDDGHHIHINRRPSIDTDDLFESPVLFIGQPPSETQDHEDRYHHMHGDTSRDNKTSRFSTAFNRFIGKRSINPHQEHIEHIDVGSRIRTTDEASAHQMDGKHEVPHTVKEMIDKTLQSDRPFSPHPPPSTENTHPNGSRLKTLHDIHYDTDGNAPFSTFGRREIKSPAHAPFAPTSLRGRHSPDLFSRERHGHDESESPQLTLKFPHEEYGMSKETNEPALPNILFSRNIHPNPRDYAQVHESLFGTREHPLPLLDNDFSDSSSKASSRASTPQSKGAKKKKSKSKSSAITDPSITSPWQKYKATLPSPLKKMKDTKQKKSSKVKPKMTQEKQVLHDDNEEQTRL